jgi:hypothetical protein
MSFGNRFGHSTAQWSKGSVKASTWQAYLEQPFVNEVSKETEFFANQVLLHLKAKGVSMLMSEEDGSDGFFETEKQCTLASLTAGYRRDMDKLLVVDVSSAEENGKMRENRWREENDGGECKQQLKMYREKISLPVPMSLFNHSCILEDDKTKMPVCECCNNILEVFAVSKRELQLTQEEETLEWWDEFESETHHVVPISRYYLKSFPDNISATFATTSESQFNFMLEKDDSEMIELLICKNWSFHEHILHLDCKCQKNLAFVVNTEICHKAQSLTQVAFERLKKETLYL